MYHEYESVYEYGSNAFELGQGSISCGQYLDRTLGKFPPLYGPHLTTVSQISVTGQEFDPPPPSAMNFHFLVMLNFLGPLTELCSN